MSFSHILYEGSELSRVRLAIGAVGLMLSMLTSSLVQAQSEDQIKAAFLLNFARYVEWPASAFAKAGDPVRICLLGADDFESVVSATVKGKTVGGRAVSVASIEAPSASKPCHILFLGTDIASAQDVVGAVGTSSVFTVSNDEGFAKNGGVANFFRAKKRIRFEINPKAAEVAGLEISSRLLRLAQLVK